MKPWCLHSAAALSLALSLLSPASAQITEEPQAALPEPRKFARGWFTDAEVGAFVPLGEAKAMGTGVGVGARFGYDLLRFVAVQVHGFGSTHRTRFESAPQSGQLLQLYQLSAELKLTLPIQQVSLFAFGGGGFAVLSTNILGTTNLTQPDETTGVLFLGGGGLDYHPLSRHFSFGLQGGFAKLKQLKAPGGILATTYLRYTF